MIQLRPCQRRGINAMLRHHIGTIVMPTGTGKTLCMIFDTKNIFDSLKDQTIVVVAPRILLASQLSSEFLEHITNAHVMHVHSGETHHYSTTNSKKIAAWCSVVDGNKIIFTTYNSLHKIQESGIKVNTIYFDEAHNSVRKSFHHKVEYFSENADRCYYFTATPKYSYTYKKPGMNDTKVYGQIICNVPAPELVKTGAIVPPKINLQQINAIRDKEFGAERDCMTLLDTILNEDHMQKVLVAAPNTKVLMRMLAETEFMTEVQSYGYDVLWITAKYGAFINNKKVSREQFFELLTEYGKDPTKKFIILHYSILSEGINCPGLTSCILMRNMDIIQMCQTIGRVIRLHPNDSRRLNNGELVPGDLNNYTKSFGMVHVPVYSNVGIQTARQLQSIVDTVFIDGEPCISVIKK